MKRSGSRPLLSSGKGRRVRFLSSLLRGNSATLNGLVPKGFEMNIRKNVFALMVLCNAIETKFTKLLHNWSPRFGGGETGRKWNELMEDGWELDLTFDGCNYLTKIVPDYNETQMQYETCKYGQACCYRLTGIKLVEAADWEGERGSVTIAARRLRRIRHFTEARFGFELLRNGIGREMGRNCGAKDAKRVDKAINTLSEIHTTYKKDGTQVNRTGRQLIINEGEREQQEIHEAQMIRLGDDVDQIAEWREERFECVSFNEAIRDYSYRSRFSRHMKQW
jgi:hypothetical protein